MPKKREDKPRWTDPVILAPIIAAVITALASPIVVPLIQKWLSEPPPPTPTPTLTPTPPNGPRNTSITVETDKNSYVIGEDFIISGNVGKPEFGKDVRIDIYKPDGGPLYSGELTKPERDGSYNLIFRSFTYAGLDLVPGTYTVRVTYLKQSAETNFEFVP